MTRPFRAKEVYAAACIDCGAEVESPTPDVPLRCASCRAKKESGKEAESQS